MAVMKLYMHQQLCMLADRLTGLPAAMAHARTLESLPVTQMLSPHASAVGQQECCRSLAYVGAWPSVSGKVNL
jgi:hypothetical protein